MGSILKAFKRLNFFMGLRTTHEDWQVHDSYHRNKRKLHNSGFHTSGVVKGFDVSIERGNTLIVGSGHAVDGLGNDIVLADEKRIPVTLSNFRNEIGYLAIRFNEIETEKRPVHDSHGEKSETQEAFIEEEPEVKFSSTEPDNEEWVELARVRISNNAKEIRIPQIPDDPKQDEIDCRSVKNAGSAFGVVDLASLGRIISTVRSVDVQESKEVFPSNNDWWVTIDKISKINSEKEGPRFYLASVFPLEEGQVSWRIESLCSKGEIEYRLFIKNFQSKNLKVSYKVYRLT